MDSAEEVDSADEGLIHSQYDMDEELEDYAPCSGMHYSEGSSNDRSEDHNYEDNSSEADCNIDEWSEDGNTGDNARYVGSDEDSSEVDSHDANNNNVATRNTVSLFPKCGRHNDLFQWSPQSHQDFIAWFLQQRWIQHDCTWVDTDKKEKLAVSSFNGHRKSPIWAKFTQAADSETG